MRSIFFMGLVEHFEMFGWLVDHHGVVFRLQITLLDFMKCEITLCH
jgi:hypothetical protein